MCVCVCSARPQSQYVVGTNQDSPAFDSFMRSENGIPSDSLMVNHHPLKLHVFWNPQFWDKAKYHIKLVI